MPNPYIVGRPVTAQNFYGEARSALIDEILEPDNPYRNYVIFGLRRYGKSSMLTELATRLNPSHLYLLWTFSGCRDAGGALETLQSSFLNPDFNGWEEIGFRFQELNGAKTLFEALHLVVEAAKQHHRPLWLLCDECASLRDFHETEPSMLARLGSLLRSDAMRVVMVGARPLSALLRPDTYDEPLLTGYERRHLMPLSQTDIERLAGASQENGGPDLTPYAEQIYDCTGGHPFLAQMICLKLYDEWEWRDAYDFVVKDSGVRSGFEQDYQFLSDHERKVVHAVDNTEQLTKDAIFGILDEHVHTEEGKERFTATLMRSGYLRVVDDQYQLANTCFSGWLADPNVGLDNLESTVSDEMIQSLTENESVSMTETEPRITILHISDLHFDNPIGRNQSEGDNVHRYKHNPNLKTLETDLADDLKNELNILPDFIIISGDITYQSQQGGYFEAEKCLLRLRAELASRFADEYPTHFESLTVHEQHQWEINELGTSPSTLYACSRIIIIPGNHDIARQGTEAVSVEEHYKRFYLNIYGRTPHSSLMHWHYDEKLDVAIVGFNSARLEPQHRLGFVDSQQFSIAHNEINRLRREAGRSGDDRTLRIAVVHHHLVQVIQTQHEEFTEGYFGVMMNAEQVIRELIRQRFSIVLHGHQHMPFTARAQRFFRGRDAKAKASSSWQLAICAAGSAGVIHEMIAKEYGANHYNLITVQGGTAMVKWRRGSHGTNGFLSDEDFELPLHRP